MLGRVLTGHVICSMTHCLLLPSNAHAPHPWDITYCMVAACYMAHKAFTLRAASLGFSTQYTIQHWLPCYICNLRVSGNSSQPVIDCSENLRGGSWEFLGLGEAVGLAQLIWLLFTILCDVVCGGVVCVMCVTCGVSIPNADSLFVISWCITISSYIAPQTR